MLTQPLLDMLAGLEKVFTELEIDFYLVGAVARDIQFSLKDENIRARATEDVDICRNGERPSAVHVHKKSIDCLW